MASERQKNARYPVEYPLHIPSHIYNPTHSYITHTTTATILLPSLLLFCDSTFVDLLLGSIVAESALAFVVTGAGLLELVADTSCSFARSFAGSTTSGEVTVVGVTVLESALITEFT